MRHEINTGQRDEWNPVSEMRGMDVNTFTVFFFGFIIDICRVPLVSKLMNALK